MLRLPVLLLALALCGCAVTEECPELTEPVFWGLWWDGYCQLDVSCNGWYDLDACYDDVLVSSQADIREYRGHDYEPDAARQALSDLDAAICDDLPDVIWDALAAAYGE